MHVVAAVILTRSLEFFSMIQRSSIELDMMLAGNIGLAGTTYAIAVVLAMGGPTPWTDRE